jgi:hypothetical protein
MAPLCVRTHSIAACRTVSLHRAVSFCRRTLIAGLLVVVALGAPAATSASDQQPDWRTTVARRLVDEMQRRLREAAFASNEDLERVASYDFLLGRREAAAAYLRERERTAAPPTDPEQRIRDLAPAAAFAAAVAPDTARRWLAELESLLATLPPENSVGRRHLAQAWFELGDWPRVIETFDRYPPTEIFDLAACGAIGARLVREGRDDRLAQLRQIVRGVQSAWEPPDPRSLLLEIERIDALARSGLPDEAVARRAWCRQMFGELYPAECGIRRITHALVRANRPEEARYFLQSVAPESNSLRIELSLIPSSVLRALRALLFKSFCLSLSGKQLKPPPRHIPCLPICFWYRLVLVVEGAWYARRRTLLVLRPLPAVVHRLRGLAIVLSEDLIHVTKGRPPHHMELVVHPVLYSNQLDPVLRPCRRFFARQVQSPNPAPTDAFRCGQSNRPAFVVDVLIRCEIKIDVQIRMARPWATFAAIDRRSVVHGCRSNALLPPVDP